MKKEKTGFTLPGESGYEKLTLELAKRWGADVIRDSDGTVLSDEILSSGYDIYSTICVIREHNDFLKANPDCMQQTFLMTSPVTATENTVSIDLMKDFFGEQFLVNSESTELWQVFDRTTNTEVSKEKWRYSGKFNCVIVQDIEPWHQYTVNFMAYRIWEEISMYNHTTNNWDKEHLMQLDPYNERAAKYLCEYMHKWCEEHPATNVVRFTSLFYNFVWIWGSNKRNRDLFTDWASYDFSVSPLLLKDFSEKYGYELTSEDFINKGLRNPCHMPYEKKQWDYLFFVQDFVIKLGKQLVNIVHSYGKKAYLFYDDCWVGSEPGSERFKEFGFDGLIKCVFSAFEVRLCADVDDVDVHEIRLHPYLFPVGLGGKPTFSDGGTPEIDARIYWANTRRALLRKKIDRIGLGGYLSLTQNFPKFIEEMDLITDEFNLIRDLHDESAPVNLNIKIGIVTHWGKLRRWTCGGHYHEHPDLDLLNILETLAGMPVDVSFFTFGEIINGVPDDIDILINAGFSGSATSGGAIWNNPELVKSITKWTHNGGTYLGIGEPSAVENCNPVFKMAHVLGVDKERGELLCHGKWEDLNIDCDLSFADDFEIENIAKFRVVDAETVVLKKDAVTMHKFGNGRGIYFSNYVHTAKNASLLFNVFKTLKGIDDYNIDVLGAEFHVFNDKIAILNNNDEAKTVKVTYKNKNFECELQAFSMQIQDLN